MKSIDSCLNQASAETLASIQGSIHLAVVPTSLVSGEFIAVGKIHIETTGGEGATSCEPAHHSTPNHSSAHQNPWPIGYDLGRRGGDTPCFP